MDNNNLAESLKKYVNIFLDEYSEYLDKDQLDTLKSINYDNVIYFDDLSYPVGTINLKRICLSNNVNDLINVMKNMPNYRIKKNGLNNKNYSTYLRYVCENGYDANNYYMDHLMYLIFKMILKNDSGLIDGFVNKEVEYLGNKYRLRVVNLYKREAVIGDRVIKIIGRDNMLKILFMDKISAFKYLNEVMGYRYAKLFYNVSLLIDEKYQILLNSDYRGFEGIIDYAHDYDSILYGDVYNYLLDFNIKNNRYM